MTSITASRPLTPKITLASPPHHRLLDALDAALDRWAAARHRAAVQRAARREARARHDALARLDARTLRDVGLGDWAPAASDGDAAVFRRTLDLRGF